MKQSISLREHWGQRVEILTLNPPESDAISNFPGVAHGVGPGTRIYGYTPNLSRWISKNRSRFDVAVVHGLWNHASVGGWQGLRRARLPYVLFTHGMMDPWFRKSKPIKHWVKQSFWAIQGRVLRDANEVLFTSEEEMRLADGVFFGYNYRPRVVAYAAAEATPCGLVDEAAFHKLVPELAGRPYLLFLSRIHEKKGCNLLLEGFAKAVHRPDLQLVIAGPPHGDLGERLQAQAHSLGIAERVHWPGMVKGAAKAGAFRGAEAFVLTSHQENFGIAVAEALAYGKPVLISNQINIWREIESGGAGVVAPDTVDGATRVIAAWEQLTPEARIAMGRAAREVYERNFTVEAAARDLTAALERAAASGPQR
ncbi:glycosyltransferase [Gemmobacter sp. 24YEA27]|uniref:glycosyltransferase n=1 Tax=Gemmobacter sp. 24YEA27 TaxID=3040672 RepID=UPI0024B321E0|nr:glycosyltransferase [Gemmobacter sp. 24YEA27]